MKSKFRFLLLLAAFLTVGSISAAAQNMSGTVKIVVVKFPAGKNQTTIRGTASYAMSYVYTFRVKQGQTITIKTDSKEPDLTFSLFAPKSETELAFAVKEWSGEAAEAGTYSITLVMNNENAKRVPYSLLIKVQ